MLDRTWVTMATLPFSLPRDLVIEILFKLRSPRWLIRLTAVSKALLSLIRSPEFVAAYRSRCGNEQFFCRSIKDGGRFSLITDHVDGDGNNLWIERGSIINPDNTLPIRFLDNFHPFVYDFFTVVGSFNGLICLSFSRWRSVKRLLYDDGPWTIFLWNPSIRRHLVLPPPPILPKKSGRLGFGGSGDGDHKVVRILWVNLNESEEVASCVRPFLSGSGGDRVVTVEIYSLNSGEWRILQFDLCPKRSFVCGHAFLHGKMHWSSCKDNSPATFTRVITSFSIDEETFQDISFPTSNGEFVNVWVSVVGESIGFLDVHFPSCCYVWVMQEFGNAKSWAKLYNMEFDVYNEKHLKLEDAYRVWKDVKVFSPTNHGLSNFSSKGTITAVGELWWQSMWEDFEDSYVLVTKHVESLALLDRSNAVSDMHLLRAPTGHKQMEDDWLTP